MRRVGDAYVAHDAIVAGDILLSPGVNIWYGCVLRGDLSRITLMEDVNLQDGTIVHTDHDEPLVVESGVVVGHRALLHGVRIGRGSLIGMGAILLAGSEIGEECIIGAGALIGERKKIPPRSLVVGMPGRIVRAVTDEDAANIRRACAGYKEMAARHANSEFRPPWEGKP